MLENRINRVTIRNFRSIEEVTVDLEDLTVLVGPNGSGKSNFVDALRFVSSALRKGMEIAISENKSIWRFPYDVLPNPLEVNFEFRFHAQDGKYGFTLSLNQRNEYAILHETCSLGANNYVVEDGLLLEWSGQKNTEPIPLGDKNLILPFATGTPAFASIYGFLSHMLFYSIFPDNLRSIQSSELPVYPLDEKGSNLGAVLYDFEQKAKEPWQEDFAEILSLAVPGIDGIHPFLAYQSGRHVFVQIVHTDKRKGLDLELESDGTLRILGILAAIYQSPPLQLMGFEEPELLLHPGVMGILRDILSEASIRSQIILTTHSPDLISLFSAESLQIVELVDGATKIGQISEEQRQIINDKLFSSGDLLRIEGLRRNE